MNDKKIIDVFLERYNLTRNKVSVITGIAPSTLMDSNRREVRTYKVETIIALSQATEISPGDVLNELLKIERD